MRPCGGLRHGQADAASRVRRNDGPAAPALKDKRHMPRTAYESGEPLPGECGQPPTTTPATAASPTIRSVAETGDAGSQSSESEAGTAIKPAPRETDTCPAEQRSISVNADLEDPGGARALERLSRERVRRLEVRALRKLQASRHAEQLRPFVGFS